jgi:hypothetical protein
VERSWIRTRNVQTWRLRRRVRWGIIDGRRDVEHAELLPKVDDEYKTI